MKKVLMVSCEGLGNGGIQHVMMNIVRNLSKEFHFDMLLFTDDVRYFEPEFQTYGTIFRIPNYEGHSSFRRKIDFYIRFGRIYRGVKKILQENGPYDVIHCHNYFEAAPCLMAAKHCGVKVRISHSHNACPRLNIVAEGLQRIYRNLIAKYATHRIGCSRAAADYLFGANQGGGVPNAIDLKRFDISRYPVSKIKHSFIHVGNIGIQKNQLFVLDVFNEIQKKWADATLKLIGNKNEEYEQKLHQKIADLHLKNVEFLPHDADVPALFAQSEYMVFPSTFEGFGLVLAEAQSMRVKCFASDVVPPEADIGLCQYLPLNGSPAQWAQAVFEAADKPVGEPDTQKVSLTHYVNQIKSIYQGKM